MEHEFKSITDAKFSNHCLSLKVLKTIFIAHKCSQMLSLTYVKELPEHIISFGVSDSYFTLKFLLKIPGLLYIQRKNFQVSSGRNY